MASLPACLASSLLAQILYERGQADAAGELLNSRLPAIRDHGGVDCAVRAYRLLIRLANRDGHVELARLLMHEAEDIGRQRAWPRLLAAVLDLRLDLMLSHGDLEHAEECARQLDRLAARHRQAHHQGRFDLNRYAVLAQSKIKLARGPAPDAVATLRRLHYEAVTRGELRFALDLLLTLVGSFAVGQQPNDAQRILAETVKLAAIAGLPQPIVDAGPKVASVVRELIQAEGAPSGLSSDLSRLLCGLSEASPQARPARQSFRSSAALSSREGAVLECFGRGLSNKRIAQELSIAPETVKSHAKHIFAKLAVQTRSEAISKATHLGLI